MKVDRTLHYITLYMMILSLCSIWSSCGSKVSVESVSRPSQTIAAAIQIDNFSYQNQKLYVNGKNLNSLTKAKLVDQNGVSHELAIDSTSDTTSVLGGVQTLSLAVSSLYNLILQNAYGDASFPITVTLADQSITAAKLSQMGATDGQVLKWSDTDGTWVPSADLAGGGGGGALMAGNGISITDLGGGVNRVSVSLINNGAMTMTHATNPRYVLNQTTAGQSFAFDTNGLLARIVNVTNADDVLFSINTTGDAEIKNSLTVGGVDVCLQNGTNCPAAPAAVTSVTASAPLASSGGLTPNISLSGSIPLVNMPNSGTT